MSLIFLPFFLEYGEYIPVFANQWNGAYQKKRIPWVTNFAFEVSFITEPSSTSQRRKMAYRCCFEVWTSLSFDC